MGKILLILGGLAIVLNPLTGVYSQALIVSGWDFLIIETGWVATLLFGIAFVFWLGVTYAKTVAKDNKKQEKGIKRAEKKSNTKGGMKYELVQ